MKRDSSYRLSRERQLLNKFGTVLPPDSQGPREAAFGELSVTVIESPPVVSAEEAAETEKAG